ncbi:MAG: TrgA family protein [Rhodobacter sp.]|nr:TrgA family protein [Rhodobacter sp.]
MPTAPKLIAAVLLSGLGYWVALLALAYVPDHVPVGAVAPITAGLGLLWGWRFLGRGVGRGVTTSVGIGVTAAVALALSAILLISFIQMIKRSLRLSYGDPFQALQDWIAISLEYSSSYVLQADVISALLVGGLVSGLLCELTGRRWS